MTILSFPSLLKCHGLCEVNSDNAIEKSNISSASILLPYVIFLRSIVSFLPHWDKIPPE